MPKAVQTPEEVEIRTLREKLTGELRSVFENAGCERVEPSVLQPADVFLDRSGEDIRRRLYMFTDPGGTELCLRPDLTIPTCRLFLERAGDGGEARLSYAGPVYRFQPQGSPKPNEVLQAGAELLGATDREAADAEAFALAVDGCKAAGLADFEIEMGDLSLFDALVDALDIAPGWRSRLKRQFWRPDYFKELVQRLASGNADAGGEQEGLLAALNALDEKSAKSVIEDVLKLASISPVGGRSTGEIAERLLEQAADASAAPLSPEIVKLIDDFLGLTLAPKDAAPRIRELTAKAGISIEPRLEALEKRFAAIEAKGFDLSKARFQAGFGRRLEYYTGFVFELQVPDLGPEKVIAGGGRYDGLLRSLGAEQPVPAVGCAFTVERLARALKLKGETK
ncbi:ATP phosphoribosyltransferase regulatory subunit [Parvibaculum sp. MBR-TMA-1.3b-4.2]|jgi:ATP phosphoribosyltransferase regulatory subunit